MSEELQMFVSPIYEKGNKIWWWYFHDGIKARSENFFPHEGRQFHKNYLPATNEMIVTWPERTIVVLPKKSTKLISKKKGRSKKKAGRKK
jgi:hypothetical protein